jgi:hypothetical protein
MNDTSLAENVKTRSTWVRGLYMLLFALIYGLTEIVLAAMAVFQFVAVLLTRRANDNLLSFGRSLSVYIYQIARYVTFNQEERPFPFSPWPTDSANVPAEET